jgi:hypothetical protein
MVKNLRETFNYLNYIPYIEFKAVHTNKFAHLSVPNQADAETRLNDRDELCARIRREYSYA